MSATSDPSRSAATASWDCFPLEAPVDVAIAAWPWGAYLGEDSKEVGIRAKVASWRRMSSDSFIPESKATGQYLNSILAKIEATKAGYEEAILLDQRGFVGEGSGENIFLVRDGVIFTPSLPVESSRGSPATQSYRSPATWATS